VFGFLALPALNSVHRAFEREADLYGLNTSREPHGLAEFIVQVSDAVKFEPSALEEVVFHTHPSPVSRVRAAMRWRAEAAN
jgi:STE24 endopeptidase